MADPTASVRHQEVQMSMTESRFDFVNPGYR